MRFVAEIPFKSDDDQPFDEGDDEEGDSPYTHPCARLTPWNESYLGRTKLQATTGTRKNGESSSKRAGRIRCARGFNRVRRTARGERGWRL